MNFGLVVMRKVYSSWDFNEMNSDNEVSWWIFWFCCSLDKMLVCLWEYFGFGVSCIGHSWSYCLCYTKQ